MLQLALDLGAAALCALELALYCSTLLFAVWHYLTYPLEHWDRRGVTFAAPLPLFGNFARCMLGKTSYVEDLSALYRQLKVARVGGFFQSRTPYLLVCDPDLVRQVLVEDFDSFHDRGASSDERSDPLSTNLLSLRGHRWRNLRDKLSPAFTAGNLDAMFPLLAECAERLCACLREQMTRAVSTDRALDVHDLLTRFSTDVIGSCAFGVPCNCLRDPDSEFHGMGRRAYRPGLLSALAFALVMANKALAPLFPARWLYPLTARFFIDMMTETVEFRQRTRTRRKDFVDIMMRAKHQDSFLTDKDRQHHVELTYDVMAAQAYVFFVAGLDNVANTVGFCLHELSLNPALQERAAVEVCDVLREQDGCMTHTALQEMRLVDSIICEGMRKYPPSGVLYREVTAQEYTLPGTVVTLQRGEKVCVSVWALHHDPDFYPEPDRFNPERFTPEARAARHPFTYLPFGEGPSLCVASRFAMREMKVCLAALLRDFKFSVCPRTQVPLKLDPGLLGSSPEDGFWFRVEERRR